MRDLVFGDLRHDINVSLGPTGATAWSCGTLGAGCCERTVVSCSTDVLY